MKKIVEMVKYCVALNRYWRKEVKKMKKDSSK